MNENILKERITGIGLSKKESQIYLSALKTGNAPVSEIAKNAGLNRVTTYGILEKLLEKGIVKIAPQKGVQKFLAVAPDQVLSEAKQKVKALAEALPDLKNLMQAHEFQPTVQFFEGLAGIKKAYAETLKAKTEICNYANSQRIRDFWPEYEAEYIAKRKRKKIFLRGLAPDDDFGKKVVANDTNNYREIRLLNPKYFQVENEIKIFDNSMMMASFAPYPFAILIESKPVAETQRQIFGIMWHFAKK